MELINEAYEILSDPVKRSEYDRTLVKGFVNDEEVNKASSEETNNPTTDILEKEPENSNEVDELDTFLEEVSNLPKEEKEAVKEEPEKELKVKEEKEVAKSEGNLENILDMLSKKEDNKKIGNRKNNKEEK